MSRQMSFSINNQEFSAKTDKVDRKKLYGWSEVHALDDEGGECVLVSTDSSGTIIIPKGGVGLGIVSKTGNWVERSSLKVVTLDGEDADLYPSSFSNVNVLAHKATEEDLLDCAIAACYSMTDADELKTAVGKDIYRFDYCFRDSYEVAPAFLIVSEANELFMLVGVPNIFDFVGLEELAVADEDEEEDDTDDDGDIDFSMF